MGLTITAAYWFTSSTSFDKPAVTLARGLTTTFAGIALNHVPGFVAAQLAGAAVAALAARIIFSRAGAGDRLTPPFKNREQGRLFHALNPPSP